MSNPIPINIDEAVEQAMDAIRSNHYLSTEVNRHASLEFVRLVLDHLQNLEEEIATEWAKHG